MGASSVGEEDASVDLDGAAADSVHARGPAHDVLATNQDLAGPGQGDARPPSPKDDLLGSSQDEPVSLSFHLDPRSVLRRE